MRFIAVTGVLNHITNRDPVMNLGEREIEEALNSLREKKLGSVIFGAGARVQKYRHILPEIYNFTPQENALLCVLLLRGAQTPGELRARAERMAGFSSLAEVEIVLEGLAKAAEPLVRLLPPRAGQKERRYVQLLAGEPAEDLPGLARDPDPGRSSQPPPGEANAELVQRVEAFEQSLAEMRQQLATVRDELAQFRKQFE